MQRDCAIAVCCACVRKIHCSCLHSIIGMMSFGSAVRHELMTMG